MWIVKLNIKYIASENRHNYCTLYVKHSACKVSREFWASYDAVTAFVMQTNGPLVESLIFYTCQRVALKTLSEINRGSYYRSFNLKCCVFFKFSSTLSKIASIRNNWSQLSLIQSDSAWFRLKSTIETDLFNRI